MLSDYRKQTPADGEDGAALAARTMEILAQRAGGARLEGDRIRFTADGLTAAVTFPVLDGPRFQTAVRLEHPSLFTPLTESAAGAAESGEEKAELAAQQILYSVLDAWLPALRKRGVPMPAVELWGQTHRFLASASSLSLQGIGEPPGGRDLWSRMSDLVMPCLGSQSFYGVKLFLAQVGDEVSSEVRINGWPVPELAEPLAALAGQWPRDGQPLRGAKQYVVLAQDPDTRVVCPYTWKGARDLARRAIALFESGMEPDQLLEILLDEAAVPELAEDVFNFLPEQMAGIFLPDIQVSSQIILHPAQGGGDRRVWFTQCRAWDPIYRAVQDHLRLDRPGRDQILSIVEGSGLRRAAAGALESGGTRERLLLTCSFWIPEGYMLW